MLLSCQKEEFLDSEIPQWLKPRIEEINNSDQCKLYFVDRYMYKNKYYYDVVNTGINCILCEVYDSQGNLVNFEENEDIVFLNKRYDRKTIWICPDFNTE